MIKKSILVVFIIQMIFTSLFAGGLETTTKGTVIRNENGPLMSLLLQSDDSYALSINGSSALDIYSKTGAIKGGYNASYFENDVIPLERRRLLTDFDIIKGEGNYLLLVGAQFQEITPEALVLKFPNSDNLLNPTVIQLEKRIAASRLRVDSAGNFYLLGMAESDFRKIIINRSPADCPIIHKFNPAGDHVYSALTRHVDSSPREYALTYSSPVLNPSNFAVSLEGEVWMLWYELLESQEKGWPATTLFNVDPDGYVREINPDPPETGYILASLIKNAVSSEVIFSWKRNSIDVEMDTILTDPTGVIILKGNFPGRILSINDTSLVTTALKDGRHAVIKYSY